MRRVCSRPETDLFEDMDVGGLRRRADQGAPRRRVPQPVTPAKAVCTWRRSGQDPGRRRSRAGWAGTPQPPVEVDPKDRRFAAPAWDANPAYYSIRLAYLAAAKVGPGRGRVRARWRPTQRARR